MTDYDVIHNEPENRFEITVDGELARLLYRIDADRPTRGRIIFTSTQTPPALEGRGIGSALARAGLDYARAHSLTVVPQCSFIRAYIERHPEYQSLTG